MFNRRIAVVDQELPTLKICLSCKEVRLDRGFVTKVDGISHSRSPVNQAQHGDGNRHGIAHVEEEIGKGADS